MEFGNSAIRQFGNSAIRQFGRWLSVCVSWCAVRCDATLMTVKTHPRYEAEIHVTHSAKALQS